MTCLGPHTRGEICCILGRQNYSSELRGEVIGEMIRDFLASAIFEPNLRDIADASLQEVNTTIILQWGP